MTYDTKIDSKKLEEAIDTMCHNLILRSKDTEDRQKKINLESQMEMLGVVKICIEELRKYGEVQYIVGP